MTTKPPPGRVVRPAIHGGTKVIRVQARDGAGAEGARWSEAAEERFLDQLAATCNVTAAAEAAGFSTTTLYKRRARWPGFAAEWDAAIAQGYARLEARLVELATDSLRAAAEAGAEAADACDDGRGHRCESAGGRAAEVASGPRMTVAEAMNLLRLHRASVRGGAPQRYGWRRGAPDPEALRASILRKIEAIERADAREPVKRRRAAVRAAEGEPG